MAAKVAYLFPHHTRLAFLTKQQTSAKKPLTCTLEAYGLRSVQRDLNVRRGSRKKKLANPTSSKRVHRFLCMEMKSCSNFSPGSWMSRAKHFLQVTYSKSSYGPQYSSASSSSSSSQGPRGGPRDILPPVTQSVKGSGDRCSFVRDGDDLQCES